MVRKLARATKQKLQLSTAPLHTVFGATLGVLLASSSMSNAPSHLNVLSFLVPIILIACMAVICELIFVRISNSRIFWLELGIGLVCILAFLFTWPDNATNSAATSNSENAGINVGLYFDGSSLLVTALMTTWLISCLLLSFLDSEKK